MAVLSFSGFLVLGTNASGATLPGVAGPVSTPELGIVRPSPEAAFTVAPSPLFQGMGRKVQVPAPPRAGTRLVIGSYQQQLINADRARAGLGPLSWSSCLYAVAVANARRMAAQGYISHTNGAWADYSCGLGVQGGENVGWWSGGIDDAQLNSMFMASADHRANILGPYHFVATSWAVAANGFAYIAVEFN